MITAGLFGDIDDHIKTANLIYAILNSYNKKVSIFDCKNLKEPNSLKSYISEIEKNESDFLLLKIDANNFEQQLFDYQQFDIILYNNETDTVNGWNMCKLDKPLQKILPFLNERGTIILNEDLFKDSDFIKSLKYKTVTYGFNSKSELTISSIADTLFGQEIIFYQQSNIRTINGSIINPQEYRINMEKYDIDIDIYTILSAITFTLVSGIKLKHNIPFTTTTQNFGYNIPFERIAHENDYSNLYYKQIHIK